MHLPTIFTYFDYRHYLQDIYNALKKGTPRFSYRKFATIVGSSSPNYLQLVTSRKVNFNDKAMENLARHLELKKKEITYFGLLMAFDHATTYRAKDAVYRKILKLRLADSSKTLSHDQYEFFSQWYIPVVRELLVHKEFDGTFAWIAGRIYPRLTAARVEKAVRLLEKLRLVEKNGTTGTWTQTDTTLRTPSEVMSVAIMKYHRAVMEAGKRALEDFAPDERDFRAVTLGIPKSKYKEIKRKTEQFWQEILESVKDDAPEDVYQLNLQLFPLTRKGKRRTR